MEKVWLNSYPKGLSAEVDIHEFSSLVDLFERSCARYSPRPAYRCMGASLRYSDLERLSLHLAAYLQQALRLKKGERVAIMLPNLLQHPVTTFAILRAGLVAVNVNPLYTARELKHQLMDSGAAAIVILKNFAHVLAQVRSETQVQHVLVTGMGDLLSPPKSAVVNFAVKYFKRLVPAYSLPGAIDFRQALARGRRLALQKPNLGPDDIAFLQYTGGTTGRAKSAILTHGNMVANTQQASKWFGGMLKEGEEIVITALPLYHVFALTANCLLFLKLGGLNYLIVNPRDMPGFVKELRKLRFTCMTGVNTLFNGLLNTPGFADLDFSAFKLTLGGGMAVQPGVAARWQQTTGVVLLEAYGLTETSPAVCINPTDLKQYNGCIGLPICATEVSIRDDAGNELPLGQAGELCVRGPQVMKGYWNEPDETRKVLSEEGWFRSGDIATMDERGFVRIVDRKKDMILVSGFNVYPNEVEAVVGSHPGVLEVGAIGIPDGACGQAVKVCVVRRDPDLTAEALRAYCKQQLTGYKVPKHIEFRTELPKTPVGKILRRALHEQGASTAAPLPPASAAAGS